MRISVSQLDSLHCDSLLNWPNIKPDINLQTELSISPQNKFIIESVSGQTTMSRNYSPNQLNTMTNITFLLEQACQSEQLSIQEKLDLLIELAEQIVRLYERIRSLKNGTTDTVRKLKLCKTTFFIG